MRRFPVALLALLAACKGAPSGAPPGATPARDDVAAARASATAGDAARPASQPDPEPVPADARFHPARFDLGAARDARDLAVVEVPGTRHVVDGVTVREVRFTTTAWTPQGVARPIRLQAYLATPPGAYPPHTKPGVVMAHGLGWHATEQETVEVCRNIDVVALGVSAPGLGGSEGSGPTAADPRPLFTTVPDVRGSWLYQYAFALLRGITVLQAQPEVDGEAVVLSGVSMGGVASLIAGGVDPRVKGVMVVSASGGIEPAVAAGTWLRRLVLSSGGLKPADRAAQAFFGALDPLAYAGRQHGAVYLLVGAQDQFFPLDQVVATYQALRAPAKSLAVVADYDHGWYFAAGCPARCMPGARPRPRDCPGAPTCPRRCPAGARPPYCGPQGSYNNFDNFVPRWALLLRSLVANHAARPRRDFAPPPAAPTVTRLPDEVTVRPGPGPAPHAVRLAISDNGGYTYGQVTLARGDDGAFHLRRRLAAGAILIAEIEAKDGAVATSVPELPAGYRQLVRPFGPPR